MRVRSLWEKYYADAHGLIFVMDSADVGRFEEARMAFGEYGLRLLVWVSKSTALSCACSDFDIIRTSRLPTCIMMRQIEIALFVDT